MTVSAADVLAMFAALIPLGWVLVLIAIPLTAVFDAISLRSQRRPGMAPLAEPVGDDQGDLLAA